MLWGTSGIFVSILAPYGITSLQMTAARATVSFICMLVYSVFKNRAALKVRLRDLVLLLITGVALFFVGSCYFTSMQLTSVSTAVILMYAAPIYVSVYSCLFLGERFSPMKAAAIIMMLIGCVLVSGIVGGAAFDSVGILIGILSGISYGAYNILTKTALRRGIDSVQTTLYTFLFMSVLSLCVCDLPSMATATASAPVFLIPMLILLGVVTFVAPYILYTAALKHLPAGTCSALAIVEPVSAAVFGAALLGEETGIIEISGIAVVAVAVLLLSKEQTAEESGQR